MSRNSVISYPMTYFMTSNEFIDLTPTLTYHKLIHTLLFATNVPNLYKRNQK